MHPATNSAKGWGRSSDGEQDFFQYFVNKRVLTHSSAMGINMYQGLILMDIEIFN